MKITPEEFNLYRETKRKFEMVVDKIIDSIVAIENKKTFIFFKERYSSDVSFDNTNIAVEFSGYWNSNDHSEIFSFPIEYLWAENWEEEHLAKHERLIQEKKDKAERQERERAEIVERNEYNLYLKLADKYGKFK